jgi:hypothetical protein
MIDRTLPLFSWAEARPLAAPDASEQAKEIVRVERGIALDVQAFCRTHPTFHADELRAYVAEKSGRAPASPDRILRQLRSRGALRYRCIDRAASLYEVLEVRP